MRRSRRFHTCWDVRVRSSPAADAGEPISQVIEGARSVDSLGPRRVVGSPVLADRFGKGDRFERLRALFVYRIAIAVQDHQSLVPSELDSASEQPKRHVALEHSGVALGEGHRCDDGIGCFQPVVGVRGAERADLAGLCASHEPLNDINPMRHQIGDTAAPEVPKEPPETETGRVERLRRGRPEPPLPVQLAQVDVLGYLCPEFGVVLGPVAAHECDLA